jgi:hypothetical protein
MYSGVKPCDNTQAVLYRIITTLHGGPASLIDEFYFQMIKQTINNPIRSSVTAVWDLFARVSSIFPCTGHRFRWIAAHMARTVFEADPELSRVASFAFMRLQARVCIGTVYDFSNDDRLLRDPTDVILSHTFSFGVLLYELVWAQRAHIPRMPIPYVLHYMIELFKERGGLRAEGIFTNSGNDGLVREIRGEVNRNMSVLTRGDANVLGSLIKLWLHDLPNPIVPIEMAGTFIERGDRGQFRGFLELLPSLHQRTLTYLSEFLKDVLKNAEYNGLERSDLATVFGPCIVNPLRSAGGDAQIVQKLTGLSVAFCNQLLQERESAVLYPLNPEYLQPLKKKGKARATETADEE